MTEDLTAVLAAMVIRASHEMPMRLRAGLLDELQELAPGALDDLRRDQRPEALRARAPSEPPSDSSRSDLMDAILVDVMREFEKAAAEYAPPNSPHETYGILMEEVGEFFDEVRKKNYLRLDMRGELVQVAVVALRAIMEIDKDPGWVKR